MKTFRKLISLILIALSIALCLGCGWLQPNNFEAKYYWGSHKYGYSAFLANTKQDFEDIIAESALNYDDFSVYNDKFFSQSSLIAIFLPIGSGSIKLKVKSLEYTNGALVVHIDKYSPKMQTCDMSYWLILVKPDSKISDDTKVNFTLTDVSRSMPDLRQQQ